jgi:D-psicose/D-tagatose/L-ribulose 3-epimerase
MIGALEKTVEFSSNYMCGCLTYELGYLPCKPPAKEERQVVIDRLGKLALEAKKRDMKLAMECVNRYEGYLYNALVDARETIKAIGMDNLELHADTYHMNIEEEGFYKPLVACKDVLGYIHISESHRGQVVPGTVNWGEVFEGLKDANYKGPLTLESFAAINPDLLAATCLWRPPNAAPGVLAWEGLNFLREGAAKYGL